MVFKKKEPLTEAEKEVKIEEKKLYIIKDGVFFPPEEGEKEKIKKSKDYHYSLRVPVGHGIDDIEVIDMDKTRSAPILRDILARNKQMIEFLYIRYCIATVCGCTVLLLFYIGYEVEGVIQKNTEKTTVSAEDTQKKIEDIKKILSIMSGSMSPPISTVELPAVIGGEAKTNRQRALERAEARKQQQQQQQAEDGPIFGGGGNTPIK